MAKSEPRCKLEFKVKNHEYDDYDEYRENECM